MAVLIGALASLLEKGLVLHINLLVAFASERLQALPPKLGVQSIVGIAGRALLDTLCLVHEQLLAARAGGDDRRPDLGLEALLAALAGRFTAASIVRLDALLDHFVALAFNVLDAGTLDEEAGVVTDVAHGPRRLEGAVFARGILALTGGFGALAKAADASVREHAAKRAGFLPDQHFGRSCRALVDTLGRLVQRFTAIALPAGIHSVFVAASGTAISAGASSSVVNELAALANVGDLGFDPRGGDGNQPCDEDTGGEPHGSGREGL